MIRQTLRKLSAYTACKDVNPSGVPAEHGPVRRGSRQQSDFARRRRCALTLNFLAKLVLLFSASALSSIRADEPGSRVEKDDSGSENPRALLERYCFRCHSGDKSAASLDLDGDTSDRSIVQHHRMWSLVADRLEQGDMPPADAPEQLPEASRTRLSNWLKELFEAEARRNSMDPGEVAPRRLSHAEFDNCVRDLTGVDLRPAKEFPVDPENEAGFDNSAESLSMTPSLLMKYVAAVRNVADHAVLTPRGLVFAPFPCVTETDRDHFCVQRIVDFYRRHDVRYEDYLLALWKFEQLAVQQRTEERLNEVGGVERLSIRYLQTIRASMQKENPIGPFAEIQNAWRDEIVLSRDPEEARIACLKASGLIREIREDLSDPIPLLKVDGISVGSQPLITWWNEQQSGGRRRFPGDGEDPALDEARREFCDIFPSAFFVASRGHYSNADLGADVRLLSAGFHLMQGYFRDDQPLRELVLTPSEILELDQLWDDLEFVTDAPTRQYKDFLFFERAEPPQFAAGSEFDFARPENKDVTTDASLQRMHGVYRQAAADRNASETALKAIDDYFVSIQQRIRWIEEKRPDAEAAHLRDLKRFASRAWRGPLHAADEMDIDDFYRRLRNSDGLSHEDAVRDSIASILLSPRFCFKSEAAVSDASSTGNRAADGSTPETAGIPARALTDLELASRLSFFLWASLPDEELLMLAARNELSKPVILEAQINRMLNDVKVMGLAREFLGHWLQFRRFEEHNAVDRERYSSFDPDLRSAMFEEPLRFFVDLMARDGSVHELIDADHTFVNAVLARHYGVSVKSHHEDPEQNDDSNIWYRIDGAAAYGRGGLLPMSVFLTQNSPGLRTSPVKRGYWVVRRLLGEHIPGPPPNVPELPRDEAHFGQQTLAKILASHRDNPACAGCHDRFDSVGLIFEAYGPVGDLRQLDLAGNPVETEAIFPDGTRGSTLEDLKRYLMQSRFEHFERNFTEKLLSFSLGRSLQLSDTQTIRSIQSAMKSESGSIRAAVHAVIASPQFRLKRTFAATTE